MIKIGSKQQWVDRDCRRKAERQAAVFWDDKQGRSVAPFHMRHDPIRAPDIAPSIIVSIIIIMIMIMVAATTTEVSADHHHDHVTVTVMSISQNRSALIPNDFTATTRSKVRLFFSFCHIRRTDEGRCRGRTRP
jgi:hypothetical protein